MGKALELIKGSEQYKIVLNYFEELTKGSNWSFGIEEHSNIAYLYQSSINSINVVHILIGEKLTIGISHLLYWICLQQVNKIYIDFMISNQIEFTNKFYSGTDLISIKELPNFNKNEFWLDSTKPRYKIGSKESFGEIKTYLETNALPFFSEIASVKDVNDKILEKVSFDEYSNYIPGNTALKVLIILKLCNKSKYNDYKIYLNNMISSQIKDPEYASYIDIINRQQKRIKLICEYLEGIE